MCVHISMSSDTFVCMCVEPRAWWRVSFSITLKQYLSLNPELADSASLPTQPACLQSLYVHLPSAGARGELPCLPSSYVCAWGLNTGRLYHCYGNVLSTEPSSQPPSPSLDPYDMGLMSDISSQSIYKKIGSHVVRRDEFLYGNELLPVIYLHLFSAQQMRHHVAS